MNEIFWTESQKPRLMEVQENYQLPEAVVQEICKVLEILDTNYGKEREIFESDGGYVFLILADTEETKKLYSELLNKYKLNREEAEFKDLICQDKMYTWHSDLFILSNDFGITIIYRIERGYAV